MKSFRIYRTGKYIAIDYVTEDAELITIHLTKDDAKEVIGYLNYEINKIEETVSQESLF